MTTSRVVLTSDWKVLEVLAHDFSLDGETVAGFALSAERLAQPYRRTVLNSPPEIRAGRAAIAGLMNQGGLAHLCTTTNEAAPSVAVFDGWTLRTRAQRAMDIDKSRFYLIYRSNPLK